MISVCIPTVGRVDTLAMVLTSIRYQDVKCIQELILLDEGKRPVCESPVIGMALDMLSLDGVDVRIIRSRERNGLGAARMRFLREARESRVLMMDDDVTINPSTVLHLSAVMDKSKAAWAVPSCFLASAALEIDGYVDKVVDRDDPEVVRWTSKYPWFIPYFRYSTFFDEPLPVAGTQCILVDRKKWLSKCSDTSVLGSMPREDTYMTQVTGPGMFTSHAESVHFAYRNQDSRDSGMSALFYKLHDVIMKEPETYLRLFQR